MRKIRCYKCEGKGKVGTEVNDLLVVFTLGFAALADDSETCNACKGKGYLEEDEE